MRKAVTTLRCCRICESRDLTLVLDLGSTPLANSFLMNRNQRETYYPLQVLFCNNCYLVQLKHVVNPEIMFSHYLYRTSASTPMALHFGELARYLHSKCLDSSKNLVIEVGSNDGTLLGAFRDLGCKVVGIDPAENLAKIANERGLETVPRYFNVSTAELILQQKGRAKLLVANNVVAHVHDLHDFMRAVCVVLENEGFVSFEFPYVGDLNQNVEYDTIYHEHLSYFSVLPIQSLFSQFGFRIVEVTRHEVHGGSIRIIAKRTDKRISRPVFLRFEKKVGLDRLETFTALAYRVEYQKEYLRHTLEAIRATGKRIIGYGAPAKGNTLLNVCKIGPETLDYLIDSTPEKQGRFSPGTHIPIYSERKFRKEQPQFALMLAWNYEKQIIMKEMDYTGQFIIPLPSPKVLPKNQPETQSGMSREHSRGS